MKENEFLEPANETNGSKEKRTESISSSGSKEMPETSHIPDVEGRLDRSHLNAIFENPLAGIPRDRLMKDVQEFCLRFNLMDDLETFQKGALVSQDPEGAATMPELSEFEKETLIREKTHKWSQPWQLYWLASKCLISHPTCLSLAACIRMVPMISSLYSYVFNGSRRPRYG